MITQFLTNACLLFDKTFWIPNYYAYQQTTKPYSPPPKKNITCKLLHERIYQNYKNTEEILIVHMLFYPTLYSILCLALTTWCLLFGQAFNIITQHILMKLNVVYPHWSTSKHPPHSTQTQAVKFCISTDLFWNRPASCMVRYGYFMVLSFYQHAAHRFNNIFL